MLHIGGGINYPSVGKTDEYINSLVDKYNCQSQLVNLLFQRYGTLVEEIIHYKGELQSLSSNSLITENEINYLVDCEKVVHLDDLLLRRTSIGWLGGIDMNTIEEIAGIAGETLKWDPDAKAKEIEHVLEIYCKNHGVEIN